MKELTVDQTKLATAPVGAGALVFSSLDNKPYVAVDGGAYSALVTAAQNVTMPTGALVMYGAAAAPVGWLLCDGTAVSRATYAALFAVLGTAYGVGDGSTTFNLPDMRQRFPLGLAASGTGNTLGVSGGAIDHTHVSAHSHTVGTLVTGANIGTSTFAGGAGSAAADGHTHTITGSTASASPVSTSENPPFQTVTFIVKT